MAWDFETDEAFAELRIPLSSIGFQTDASGRAVMGLTVVALGTSMPEFLVNFFAAFYDEDNLALACAHCNRHKGPNLAGFDPETGMLYVATERGHSVTFFEPDAFGRQQHRDMEDPDWARVVVYPATEAGVANSLEAASNADGPAQGQAPVVPRDRLVQSGQRREGAVGLHEGCAGQPGASAAALPGRGRPGAVPWAAGNPPRGV